MATTHVNPNASVLTVSPPDSGFSPRREFMRDNHPLSTFALLAIAGTGFVRLTSFSQELVDELRRAFHVRQLLRSIREDRKLKLIEFSLDQKPWANSKNIDTERLFVDILAVIFQHGYIFVSTIDYGREHDDRLSIAFSRPQFPSPTSPSPDSPVPLLGLPRVPFALSFPSSTVLRVINPPLNSTPAILQGVRSSWPRGVVSEKKVSDRCFEFKLKGYRWFQEDTFSADSLQYILGLLNSLDHHSFALLTSISLSGNRSRVKDLWIFIGPPNDQSDNISNNSSVELSRSLSPMGSRSALCPPTLPSSSTGTSQSGDMTHHRSSSLPAVAAPSSPLALHMRSATEPDAAPITHVRTISPRNSHSVLRKRGSPKSGTTPPPSGHGHSPLGRASEEDEHSPRQKGKMGSVESIDMTGIGSANQRLKKNGEQQQIPNAGYPLYAQASPRPSADEGFSRPQHAQGTSYEPQQSTGRIKTGDLFYETGPPSKPLYGLATAPNVEADEPHLSLEPPSSLLAASNSDSSGSSRQLTPRDIGEPPRDVPQSVYGPHVLSEARTDSTPPILSPGVFRDSAFSSSTSQSFEVPISWTGGQEIGGLEGENWKERITVIHGFGHDSPSPRSEDEQRGSLYLAPDNSRRANQRQSASYTIPGAWQPTPIDERPEEQVGLASPASENMHEDVNERMPERKVVDAVRVASPTLSQTPGATRRSEVALYGMVAGSKDNPRSPPSQERPVGGTGGWVLVNIGDGIADGHSTSANSDGSGPSDSAASRSRAVSGKRSTSPLQEQKASLSPIAKVIAAADAVSPTPPEEKQQSSSAFRRFFSGSRSKSDSRKLTADGRVAKVKTFEQEETGTRARKLSLRDRWRTRRDTNDG